MHTACPEAAAPAPLPAATDHFLLLALAGMRLALPRGAVRELLPLPRLARPPGLPPVVAGFAGLGGALLPVLHATRLLGLRAAAPEDDQADGLYRHIVVLEEGFGLLVDRALDLLALPAGSLQPVDPAHTLNGCVAATLPTAQGPAHLLDPARLLLAREREALAGLAEAAQHRARGWQP
ncbi:chemotaxis protein CheW [Roseomonas haemaphysalidis]|uniref:Chemotaxis protein CheW n=1 Tax=Roseomonas haemaphysalidis TaxID=2768162 RepID=A0ABS3KPK3_9PROT|nr:chemotaxis protein CheW [Roseomonas haemaphysalidis]MBO1079362.1 chemotaxis protein CheW [Roseomonas haemaphysalidis]